MKKFKEYLQDCIGKKGKVTYIMILVEVIEVGEDCAKVRDPDGQEYIAPFGVLSINL